MGKRGSRSANPKIVYTRGIGWILARLMEKSKKIYSKCPKETREVTEADTSTKAAKDRRSS